MNGVNITYSSAAQPAGATPAKAEAGRGSAAKRDAPANPAEDQVKAKQTNAEEAKAARIESEQAEAEQAEAAYPSGTRVSLDVDRDTKRVIGRYIDLETGEVVGQVPSEEMIRLLAKTREMLGALFDEVV